MEFVDQDWQVVDAGDNDLCLCVVNICGLGLTFLVVKIILENICCPVMRNVNQNNNKTINKQKCFLTERVISCLIYRPNAVAVPSKQSS